jgi:hypothetical protein
MKSPRRKAAKKKCDVCENHRFLNDDGICGACRAFIDQQRRKDGIV